ncbi:MAG: hypothetical protein HW384_144 [Dehalococcoidia bacterium]|nr:hypothetical protein [Dehalococcoidia bacterium]
MTNEYLSMLLFWSPKDWDEESGCGGLLNENSL